jgi:hypothetical protein
VLWDCSVLVESDEVDCKGDWVRDGLLVSAVPRNRVQLAPTILVRAAIGAHRACDMYIVAASSPCREMSYRTD